MYSVVLPCNHQSTKKVMGGVFCITPNARWSSEDWWSGFWNWSNQLPFRIVVHCALIRSVSLQYIKMTKLQSHSVSIGEFSVHDIPNFETPLVRGFVPYLDSVTSKRLKDFVMCLEYENELALSGAILNFPRTLLLVWSIVPAFWLVYFPVRLRDLARQVALDLEFCLLLRFSCFWNMYQLMDRRFPGGLCHIVYCVDLNDISSLIRITHNRMKHFLTWTHQAVSCNGCIQIKMNKYTHASMFMVPWFIPWFASTLALENHG